MAIGNIFTFFSTSLRDFVLKPVLVDYPSIYSIYLIGRSRGGASICTHGVLVTVPPVSECSLESTSKSHSPAFDRWEWGRHLAQWHLPTRVFVTVVPVTDRLGEREVELKRVLMSHIQCIDTNLFHLRTEEKAGKNLW